MANEIKIVYDEEQSKFITASIVESIALNIVAEYIQDLTPGGEIIVSITVTNLDDDDEEKAVKDGKTFVKNVNKTIGQKLWSWLRQKGCTILNKMLTTKKIDEIVHRKMVEGGKFYLAWTIEKGLKGRYTDLAKLKLDKDSSWRIIMNDTPIEIIEAIGTELCKTFHQQTVLIHNFENNTFKLWNRK